jgi:phenylalanyl-tRNA synthetase alpha chain
MRTESVSRPLDGRKNGILTQINDLWLKGAPKDAKREAGNPRQRIEGADSGTGGGSAALAGEERWRQLRAAERVDISLPGIRRPIGAEHPVIKTTNEMVRVFQKLGYSVADGPVVETDYYNFEA